MFEEFVCRVAESGVPHEVEHIPGIAHGPLKDLSGEEMCQWYWLLKYFYINLRIEIDKTIIIFDNAKLGDEILYVPRSRVAKRPEFLRNYIDSMYGLRHKFSIDFSKIYFTDEKKFSVDFTCEIFDSNTSRDDSSILLSFERDVGSFRDLYISREFEFLGTTHTVYLNYQSGIWSDINFESFSIDYDFWE